MRYPHFEKECQGSEKVSRIEDWKAIEQEVRIVPSKKKQEFMQQSNKRGKNCNKSRIRHKIPKDKFDYEVA